MAQPMTADQMLAALRAEGLTIVEHPGWRTHNREGHGAWGPVNGVLIHHTGGTAPSDGEIVWSGRADLPGPDAHAYNAKSGVITLTGNGRANHAGGGDPAVLAAVSAESYGDRPPAPHEHEGSAGAVDGNVHFYGLECSNLGDNKDPWPPVQYDAAVRWAAAILRFHGWSAKSAIGHKEWSDWKPDPTFDMPVFRAAVTERLAHPASWNPLEEDPMAGITKADIFDAVWNTDKVAAPKDNADIATNPTWAPQSYLRDIDNRVRAVQATEAAQTATIATLATTVAALAANTASIDPAALVAEIQAAINNVTIHLDATH